MKYKLISRIFCWVFTPIFFLNPLFFYGQSDIDNHRKYWYYRSRLNNDFVKVGTGAGESMPFNQRGFWANDFNDNVARLSIGDGTSTLGYYIALLATEYYLLKENSQNTDKVKHELFCALNAVNRLDAKAEDLYNQSNQYQPLNGFFIRDDIPTGLLLNNYEHFNYFSNGGSINNNQPSRGFASKFNAGAKSIFSSWISAVEENDPGLFYESQDQAYNILFGLAFVNKFVLDTETDGTNVFGYGSNETSLTKEARNIAGRIIDHIRDSKHVTSGISCNGNVSTGWKIYNPVTCTPVSIGENATPFAYPLAELECLIKNGMSGNSGSSFGLGTIPHLCQGNGYHNTWSNSLGYTTWNALAASSLPNIDNRVFVENLSAACNCVYGTVADKFIQQTITYLKQIPILSWLGIIIGWLWQVVSAIITTFVPGLILNTTSTAININAYNPNSPLDHGPLARKVLHGGIYTPNPDYTIKYLLDVAPCDDIYYFPGGNYGHWEWSSSDRLDHPERRGGNEDFRGEYNGIDYMLYHNLWYIKEKQAGSNQYITDLSDVYIEQANGYGCFDVKAFETIRTYNTNIGCYLPTAWRAGKTIYFGSGTTITGNGSSTSGQNFHAYIQKFDCATDNAVYRMADNSDTTKQDGNDGYENGIMYHVVNYPKYDENSTEQAEYNESAGEENLITELPVEEDPIEKMMKSTYPEYSKELFIKPTITIDNVKAYFTMTDDEIAFITVLDLSGKKVFSQNNIKPADSGLTIDLTDMAAGAYLLKFTTTKGTDKTQKIIKQ